MVGRIRIRIQEFITEIHHGVRKLCTYLHYVTGCNCSEIALKQQQHIEIPLSVRPHLFRDAGHEKRREEQLKWSLELGCTLEVFHVHSYQDQFIQPGWAECVLGYLA